MLSFLTALLLTTLLHSTLLGLAALLVARRTSSPARRTWILRAAILAPLLTATLQVGSGGGLGWSSWSLRGAAETTAGALGSRMPTAGLDRAPRLGTLEPGPDLTIAAPAATGPVQHSGSPWRAWLVGAWGAGAFVGCWLLAVQRRRFLGSLQRDTFDDRDAQQRLTRLAGHTGVRLSASDTIDVPLAVSSSEICLPRTRWRDLTGGQRDALLAHELAHVERRDPLWFLLENIVERALFLQPLLRVLRRESRRAAELACDERAARATAAPMELARCLATVAGWSCGATAPPSMASMAHGDTPVVDRVERLVAFDSDSPRESSHRLFAAGLTAALVAFACGAPNVSAEADQTQLESSRMSPLTPDMLLVAIDKDGIARLSTGAGETALGAFDLDDDMQSFQTALAEAAGRFPRGGPGFTGDTLADGVLRIRTTADTEFYYVLRVMESCGAVNVQLWNLELETSGNPDEVFHYRLPTDVGVQGHADAAAAAHGRVDVALRATSTPGGTRFLEARVGYSPSSPFVEIEEEEPEEVEEWRFKETSEGVLPPSGGWGNRTEIDLERLSIEARIKQYLDSQRQEKWQEWVPYHPGAIERIIAASNTKAVSLSVREGVTGREALELLDDVIDAGALDITFVGAWRR